VTDDVFAPHASFQTKSKLYQQFVGLSLKGLTLPIAAVKPVVNLDLTRDI